MKYFLSVIEQGSGAALSFALSLWLIRGNGAEAYGVYVFWFSTALVMNSLQNSMTIAHLLPLPPGPAGAAARRNTEQTLLPVTLILAVAAALLSALAMLFLHHAESTLSEPTVSGFLPAYLLWQYSRALAFTRGDALTPVIQVGIISLVTAVGVALGWWFGLQPDANQAFLYTGSGYAVAGIGGLVWLCRGLRPDFSMVRLLQYRGLLGMSRWLFLGALSIEVSSRLYNFLVANWFGSAALGMMAATQVMLRPATLLTGAWTPVARAEMSFASSRGDRRGFLLKLLGGGAVTCGATFIWGCLVAFGWPQLDMLLYHGRFSDAGNIIWLWTIQLTLSSAVLTIAVALQALGAFRPLALAEFTGAVVAGIAMTALASRWGADFCLVGMMLGCVVQIATMLRLMPRELRLCEQRKSMMVE